MTQPTKFSLDEWRRNLAITPEKAAELGCEWGDALVRRLEPETLDDRLTRMIAELDEAMAWMRETYGIEDKP